MYAVCFSNKEEKSHGLVLRGHNQQNQSCYMVLCPVHGLRASYMFACFFLSSPSLALFLESFVKIEIAVLRIKINKRIYVI